MKIEVSNDLKYKSKVLLLIFTIVVGFFITSFVVGSYFFSYSLNLLNINSHSIIATIIIGIPYSLFIVGVLIFAFKIFKYFKKNITFKL